MRLIIVDDDMDTVALIHDSVTWRDIGIDRVDVAYNVEEAKSLLEESVDIAICDIEMPRGSGLNLIRWARENNKSTEFIFLTCHDSFGYVKEAMESMALAYVLKPFDCDEVTREVIKAVDKIKNERRLNTYGTLWLENRAIVEQRFWRDLLLSDAPPDKGVMLSRMLNRCIDVKNGEKLRLVLVRTMSCGEESQASGINRVVLEYRVGRLAIGLMGGEHGIERIIPYQQNDMLYMACLLDESTTHGELARRVDEFLSAYRAEFSDDAACYVGDAVEPMFLCQQRARLEETDRNNYHTGLVMNVADMPSELSDGPLLDMSNLRPLLEKGDKLSIMRDMKTQLETLVANGRLNLAGMYSIQQDIIQEMYVYLRICDIQPNLLFGDAVYGQLTKRAVNSLYDMIRWMSEFFGRVISYESERRNERPVAEQAKAFVRAHYAEDITREEVAKHVALAPEYFAKLFKRDTGVAIKDYINQIRIDAAKELMRATELTISQIATRVGFNSISYFTVVFKKVAGTLPNQYKSEM